MRSWEYWIILQFFNTFAFQKLENEVRNWISILWKDLNVAFNNWLRKWNTQLSSAFKHPLLVYIVLWEYFWGDFLLIYKSNVFELQLQWRLMFVFLEVTRKQGFPRKRFIPHFHSFLLKQFTSFQHILCIIYFWITREVVWYSVRS